MIQLENLSKNYGNKRIYSQVNLVFEADKSYALIGRQVQENNVIKCNCPSRKA